MIGGGLNIQIIKRYVLEKKKSQMIPYLILLLCLSISIDAWTYKPQPLSCWTRIYPTFANSVDPDQLASEEANWSGSALFAIKYANL